MTEGRKPLDVWQEENPRIPELSWRAQLSGYVGQFPTQAAADKYVSDIRKYRSRMEILAQQERS